MIANTINDTRLPHPTWWQSASFVCENRKTAKSNVACVCFQLCVRSCVGVRAHVVQVCVCRVCHYVCDCVCVLEVECVAMCFIKICCGIRHLQKLECVCVCPCMRVCVCGEGVCNCRYEHVLLANKSIRVRLLLYEMQSK